MPVCAVHRPHGSPHCCQQKTYDHELGSEIQQPITYQMLVFLYSTTLVSTIIITSFHTIIIAPREVITNLSNLLTLVIVQCYYYNTDYHNVYQNLISLSAS